jgi:hypothetical protein
MKSYFVFISLITASLLSCKQSNTIEGFDEKAWKEDYNACTNKRVELWKILSTKKEVLKNLDDDAIVDVLGSPERNRQFSKGKKNYIYFLYPGSQCKGDTGKLEGKKLVIEFNAVGKPSIIRESFLDY